MRRPRREKQVSLAVFDNEPTVRMAQVRLWDEGIPCFIKPLQGGPGMWGTSNNLPHDLLVFATDEMRARELLDLPPKEIAERETRRPAGQQSAIPMWMLVGTLIVMVAVMGMAVAIMRRVVG